MKVAIITRTKDRPLFLKRAIDSVASQSYLNYIHVIVNDGGERGVIDGMLDSLPHDTKEKIRVFHRDASSNAPDTIFNESIDRVYSEYFTIHDDDDSWHPKFLEMTVRHLDDNVALGAVVVRSDKVIEELHKNSIQHKKTISWMPDLRVINLYRQCIDNQFTPIATMFRREAYEKVGKFDNSLPVVGDWEFGIRLLRQYEADFIDPGYALAFYHHRLHGDNSFTNHNHRYYVNLVANRYLRDELNKGTLGVGYIMSKLKYEQFWVYGLVKRVLPKSIQKIIKAKRL